MNRLSYFLIAVGLTILAYTVYEYLSPPIYHIRLDCPRVTFMLDKPEFQTVDGWVDSLRKHFPKCSITLFQDGSIVPHE